MAKVVVGQELQNILVKEIKSTNSVQSEALSAFAELGFPSTKNEEWKYTNISSIVKQSYLNDWKLQVEGINVSGTFADVEDVYKLVFVNGIFVNSLSNLPNSDSLHFVDTTSDKLDEQVSTYYAKLADYKTDAFTALNTAIANQIAVFKTKKSAVVEKPVVLLHITDTRLGNVISNPRALFIVAQNSEVSFIEIYKTIGNSTSFVNAVTEIVVEQDANVSLYKIQNDKDEAHQVNTTQVTQTGKSVFTAVTFSLSGGIIRNNLNVVMNAAYCEANMYGLYLINGVTHVDNHTIMDHAMPHCLSNELYKGVLDDSSKGVFNGKIFVRKDAQKTNAFQSSKSILLSKDASVNTKPQLEIWADDVKCSHGATTGQLDEAALFYMQARGIGADKAKALLTYAFAADVLDFVKIDTLKDYLENLIHSRLYKE